MASELSSAAPIVFGSQLAEAWVLQDPGKAQAVVETFPISSEQFWGGWFIA